MKIKLLSDLHLEGRHGYEKKTHVWSEYRGEDVLVLAGDIAVGHNAVVEAIDYFLAQGFPRVIYVMGNHECYHHSIDELDKLKRTLATRTKVHMLDCYEVVKIDDVSFFGGTLWTNFGDDSYAKSAASRGINDFRVIERWNVTKCAVEHCRQVGYIKWAYDNTPGKKVIITHFMPSKDCIAERYRSTNGVDVLINKYFASDLGAWIETLSNTTWFFGHTHDAMDFKRGDTRLVSNPLGYSGESSEFSNFNPNLEIIV